MKSFYYKLAIAATTATASYYLPPLRTVTLVNAGGYDVYFEFDNEIDTGSAKLLAGQSITLPTGGGFLDNLRVQSITGSTQLYLVGLRQYRD